MVYVEYQSENMYTYKRAHAHLQETRMKVHAHAHIQEKRMEIYTCMHTHIITCMHTYIQKVLTGGSCVATPSAGPLLSAAAANTSFPAWPAGRRLLSGAGTREFVPATTPAGNFRFPIGTPVYCCACPASFSLSLCVCGGGGDERMYTCPYVRGRSLGRVCAPNRLCYISGVPRDPLWACNICVYACVCVQHICMYLIVSVCVCVCV